MHVNEVAGESPAALLTDENALAGKAPKSSGNCHVSPNTSEEKG